MARIPEILGIIPARSGSKRLPGKNLRRLGEKTLVEYALQAAVASKRLSQIVLSSDAEAILELSHSFKPGIVALKRPDLISSDTSPAITYVEHALLELQNINETLPDYVVIIQPSSPFTEGVDIDACIEAMENLNADCAASVREIQFDLHPSKLKCIRDGKLIPYFENEEDKMARDALQRVYVRNGSVYVSRIHVIQSGLILNQSCAAYIMPPERSLDINDALDWEFAEFMMAKHRDQKQEKNF